MSKAKIALSLRIDEHLHNSLSMYCEHTDTTMTETIAQAIADFLKKQEQIAFLEVDGLNENYWIRIAFNPYTSDCINEAVLGSSYAGTEHLFVKNFSREKLSEVCESFKNSVDLVERLIDI
jgi:hypothetical protein